METVEIEKGIEVPNILGRGKVAPYPFAAMAISDSIALTDTTELKRARNAAYRYRLANPGWDYGATKYIDGSGRLWRTK